MEFTDAEIPSSMDVSLPDSVKEKTVNQQTFVMGLKLNIGGYTQTDAVAINHRL